MTSETGITLTATERVLLHLKGYWQHHNDTAFPPAITQKGISETAGIRLSHVPRTLKRLITNDLVSEVKGHVEGERRRYKAYFLTEAGLRDTNHFLETIMDKTLEGFDRSVRDIIESVGEQALLRTSGSEAAEKTATSICGPVPAVEGFVNREGELENLKSWLSDSDSKVMVIYGSVGYGTSALAAKFIEEAVKGWSVCWIPVLKEDMDIRIQLVETLSEIFPDDGSVLSVFEGPDDLKTALDGKKLIIVFDGYFEVSDDVVEFFTGLVSELKDSTGLKLLFTAREDTPSYNRFYTILDLHDGTVDEIHLRGLEQEPCKTVLDTPDIAADALRRLYLFTRGCPTTLKLLASGDEAEMREKTRFSPEEIKLMLFLKGQKEELP